METTPTTSPQNNAPSPLQHSDQTCSSTLALCQNTQCISMQSTTNSSKPTYSPSQPCIPQESSSTSTDHSTSWSETEQMDTWLQRIGVKSFEDLSRLIQLFGKKQDWQQTDEWTDGEDTLITPKCHGSYTYHSALNPPTDTIELRKETTSATNCGMMTMTSCSAAMQERPLTCGSMSGQINGQEKPNYWWPRSCTTSRSEDGPDL